MNRGQTLNIKNLTFNFNKFPCELSAHSRLGSSREVKLIRLPSDSIADRGHISLIIDRYYANCTDK